jgi:Protein of unknown function (DUF3465)
MKHLMRMANDDLDRLAPGGSAAASIERRGVNHVVEITSLLGRLKTILLVTACAWLAFVTASCGGSGPAADRGSVPAGSISPIDSAFAQRPSGRKVPAADDSPIGRAFARHASDVQVQGEGTVTRVLSDDLIGDRHQRFILRLASGQTVLVTHNIDIAPRVDALKEGDVVRFSGEYVWNEKGGVIHWTHHDPKGRHVAGWVKYNGKTFQ